MTRELSKDAQGDCGKDSADDDHGLAAAAELERLILSSDCGMGREGMSRRHAFYKMVALVGADPKFSLLRTK